MAAEKGKDRRVWMECFTEGTREWFVETLLMTHQKGSERWGLTSEDLKLPTMELLEKVQPAPDNWTFEHEVTEGEEKILSDTTGWVERKTLAGRPRRYWCRLEEGRWRFDYPLTLDSER